MITDIIGKIRKYIEKHSKSYIYLLCTYLVGITIGCMIFAVLSAENRKELAQYFLGFIQLYSAKSIDSNGIFVSDFLQQMQAILCLWVLGAAIVGIPFVFLFICARGMATGFSSCFLIWVIGKNGLFLVSSWLLCSEILYVPVYLFLCGSAIAFSLEILSRIKKNYEGKVSVSKSLVIYCANALFACVAILAVSLINSWLIPVALATIL